MNDIRNCSFEEIQNYVVKIGEKKFRAKQIFKWIHEKNILSFDEMVNIPQNLIGKLKQDFYVDNVIVKKVVTSDKDSTSKYLYELKDNNVIESVLMKYKYGNSICISTQVGCRMGCKFCASTIDGLRRNLTVGEMLGQIYTMNRKIDKNINHVVLMGSGEPLENYDNVIEFLRVINDPIGYNLSVRNITISTCGLVPEIKKLADEKIQVTLAVSLHSANDIIRESLMPINKKYNIKMIIEAVDYYIEKTSRRVTFEYALMKNINDSKEHAKSLGELLRGKLIHVNLIPINAVEESEFYPTDEKQIMRFRNILEKMGINVTVRRELGSDINAACGQLRNRDIEIKKIVKL